MFKVNDKKHLNEVNKSNAPPWVFFTFFKLYKLYQIAQSITMCNVSSGCSLLQEKRRVGILYEVLDLDTRVGVLALINRSLLFLSKNLTLFYFHILGKENICQ